MLKNFMEWPLGVFILSGLFITNLYDGRYGVAVVCWIMFWIIFIIHEKYEFSEEENK